MMLSALSSICCRRHGGRGLHGDRRQEPRARRAVPDPRLLQCGGAVRAARRRVPGDDPGGRLRRRGGRAVPVRRHDARRRLRGAEGRLHQARAARRARRPHPARRAGAGGGLHRDQARRAGRAVRADPDRRLRHHQHRGDRPRALHQVRLLLPGRRPDPAGRHDRRHRADAAAQGGRQAPVDRGAGGARQEDGDGGGQGARRARPIIPAAAR